VELLGLAFTPDGHKLLATAKDDSVATATGGRVDAAKFGSVNVIDVDRQLVVSRVTVPTHPTSVAVRPDGQGYLVANVSGLHQYRDLADNRVCHSLTTGTEINALAFSPDGRTYLAGDRNGWLWLREADTGREIGEPFRATSPFWAARFTADGKHVLTGTDAGAQLWDLDTHALVRNTAGKGQVLGISLFPDGTRALLIFDGFAREWTFTAGEAVQPSLIHPEGGIDRISLSPDGTMALVTGNDGASGLWHLATGKQLGPSLATNARPVIFSHDGRRMAVGDKDGRIVLWEVARPAKGTPARIRLWYETLTRLELDPASTVRKLSAEEVRDRASELDGLGGPPVK
jgi:WD40 repeat protein